MTALPEWLGQRASLSPGRPAVIAGGQEVTFAQLDRSVALLADALVERGIRPGDRVAVLCANGLPFVELIHAVPRAGAILVPLNTRLSVAEMRRQLEDVEVSLLVHDAGNEGTAREAWPNGRVVGVEQLRRGGASCPRPEPIPLERVHSIIYTSGTTGWPKGAMLTHGNFWNSAVASALNLGHESGDRWLGVLPLFHVGGLSIVLRGAIGGITAIIPGRFDAREANRAIEEDGATIVSVVASMLERMLDDRSGRPYPSALRCVLLGGGPAPRPLLERCASLGVPVAQTYGLTETASQASTLSPEEALTKIGSAGKPLMTTEIRIEDAGDPVSAGRSGEILVRGATVTPGYWRRPEESAEALRGGWLHTGDVGYLDEEGYLYVLDRRDDLIISGGENVYPAEVEAALLAHPAIAEVGVFGIPDERWGQSVAAVLVCRVQVREEELRDFCRERLAAYKVPRRFIAAATLPRNAAGKLLRRKLPELLEDAASRTGAE